MPDLLPGGRAIPNRAIHRKEPGCNCLTDAGERFQMWLDSDKTVPSPIGVTDAWWREYL